LQREIGRQKALIVGTGNDIFIESVEGTGTMKGNDSASPLSAKNVCRILLRKGLITKAQVAEIFKRRIPSRRG